MVLIEDVTTTKDLASEITHVTIDITKHKEALPVPEQSGIFEKPQFETDCKNGTSIEESRKRIHTKIDGLWPE